jgi:RNA polymerase sigma-70 factor, ECF subfamily
MRGSRLRRDRPRVLRGTPEEPLAQLLSRLREPAQREDAFTTLFRRFHDRVYRSFPSILSEALRSELTQEVLLKVYTHLDEIPSDHFVPWLRRVAKTTFLSWYQYEHREKREGIPVPLEVAEGDRGSRPSEGAGLEPTPLDEVLGRERRQVLLAAVEELPPQMRSCLLLRLLEDCSVEEIACLLRLSPGTVKAHLHAARTRLKPKLAGYFARLDLAKEES